MGQIIEFPTNNIQRNDLFDGWEDTENEEVNEEMLDFALSIMDELDDMISETREMRKQAAELFRGD